MVALPAAQPKIPPMDLVTAEQFLLNQIPIRHRVLFAPVFKSAYDAVSEIVKAEPVLQVPTAEDNRGRVVSWAVDLGFKRLIESGAWPVDYRWAYFAKPTGRYLQVKLSHSVMSISLMPLLPVRSTSCKGWAGGQLRCRAGIGMRRAGFADG
jgi:hypothetical protein